ncbi:hypothetical protein [Aquiflexum sp.]|uniref:hypothetical protein n=1 Tax=Aquiflexum sp. TaxID=1872584 RepID=UPI00359409F3
MKKSLLFFLLSVSFQYANAQEQGDIRLQLGVDYRFQINIIGANAGAEYFFADRFSIAPNFTYWFPNVGRESNLNVDLRYYLTEGVSQIYLLGGYNNLWLNTQPGLPGTTISRAGGNFGVGSYFDLIGNLGMNTEFKIQSQNTRQTVLRIALVYRL